MENDQNNLLPDFLIVGSAKSGTTAIARYLTQHDEIFSPEVKECDFFSQVNGVFEGPKNVFQKINLRTKAEYLALFSKASSNQKRGDISPTYLLFHEKTIENIKTQYKDQGQSLPKIIIILRNPIERAFSNYMHLVRDMKEEEGGLIDGIKAEDSRMQNNWWWFWRFKELGLYARQVEAYLNSFDDVKIIFYDDFIKDNQGVLTEITDFIGVRVFNFDITKRFNESGKPKKKMLHKIIRFFSIPKFVKKFLPYNLRIVLKNQKEKWLKKNLQKTRMTEEEKHYLKSIYKDDIAKLSEVVNRDLSSWLK